MGCGGAPLSPNGGSTTATIIPNYLRPSAGSCHDICKYGRRRELEEQATKPLQKTSTTKLSIIVPTHPNKEIENQQHSADAKKVKQQPSSDAKSFSPRPKKHSNSLPNSPTERRSAALPAKIQEIKTSMKLPASVRSKPSMPSAKKAWVNVGAPLSPKGRKTAVVELLSPRRVKRVKTHSSNALESIPLPPSELEIKEDNVQLVEENQIEIPSNELEFESVEDAQSSSSSHGEEDDEEADKSASDATTTSHSRRIKRQRKSKHSRPVKLKFRMGNPIQKENNVPIRTKFWRTRRSKTDDSVSDSNNSARIGSSKTSRTRDKYGSKASKTRRRRVSYGKARVLVLENRKGNLKRKYERDDPAGAELLLRKNKLKHKHEQTQTQRKKDVQFLFNYVIEETASKLAERRKGMVKSLVGAFETLISLQTRSCFLRVAT